MNAHITSLYASDENILARTLDNGNFLSTNNGTSWVALKSLPAGHGYVSAFVSSGNAFFASTDSGVFISIDNGINWETVYSTGYSKNSTPFLSLAAIGKNVFIGSSDSGVIFSSNNGSSWKIANSGLTNTHVYCLKLDGSNLIAGTGEGVWRRPISEFTGVNNSKLEKWFSHQISFNIDATYNVNCIINIEFYLAQPSQVNFSIYDISGREIAIFSEKYFASGLHLFSFKTQNLAKGFYLGRMKIGKMTFAKAFTVLRKF
jgi:hypothetical protein